VVDTAGAVTEIRHSLDLYRRLAGARMRSDMQYRTSFALRLVGQLLVTTLDFLAIVVIFRQVPRFGGWRLEEVALLYGINGCAFALADLATGSIERVNLYIRTGRLDQVLVRPAPSLVLLTGDDFAIRRVGKLLQASTVLAIGIGALNRHWSLLDGAHVAIAIVSGAVIFSGVFVLSGAAIFWLIEGREVMNSAIYGGHFLSQYPLSIYGRWLQRFVVYVLPIAFVAYFPTVSILGKHDALGFPGWMGWTSPAVAVVLAIVAGSAWRIAIRHYRSTGS
jgi:ABC-2 type transport system permease protein